MPLDEGHFILWGGLGPDQAHPCHLGRANMRVGINVHVGPVPAQPPNLVGVGEADRVAPTGDVPMHPGGKRVARYIE